MLVETSPINNKSLLSRLFIFLNIRFSTKPKDIPMSGIIQQVQRDGPRLRLSEDVRMSGGGGGIGQFKRCCHKNCFLVHHNAVGTNNSSPSHLFERERLMKN